MQSPEFLKNALKFAQQFFRPGKCLENRDKVMKHWWDLAEIGVETGMRTGMRTGRNWTGLYSDVEIEYCGQNFSEWKKMAGYQKK